VIVGFILSRVVVGRGNKAGDSASEPHLLEERLLKAD